VGYSLESVVLNIKKAEGVKKARSEREQAQAMSGEIMGDENIFIAGKNVIRDVFGDLEFEISPNSFYQVNPVQMKRLYDQVKMYCGVEEASGDSPENANLCSKNPVILDLYCGVGTIGLYCADMAEAVVGIEIVKEAVVDANRNAVVNGIVNARYICGKAEELLPKYVAYEPVIDSETGEPEKNELDSQIAAQIKNADIAILDPPRAGCRPELLEAVANVGVDKIVYVSCDPATLARDIKLLGEMGYEFVEAQPVDMFPNTAHVEVVTLLVKTTE